MKKFIFTIITVFLLISPVDAAVGDCLSWIWGGKNEETTVATPYSFSRDSAFPSQVDNGGAVYLGQSMDSGSTVCVAPPSHTVSSPLKPGTVSTFSPAPAVKPVVSREWSYSRIKSVNFTPVQNVDPYTGVVSTWYRAEESKTLLPWLHRKEVVRYEPVPLGESFAVSKAVFPPESSSRIVQVSYDSYPGVDPCGNTISYPAESIPYRINGSTVSLSANTSAGSSTFVSPNVETGIREDRGGVDRIPNFATPGDLDPYYNTAPASVGDASPVLEHSYRPPTAIEQTSYTRSNAPAEGYLDYVPILSPSDMQPIEPFTSPNPREVKKRDSSTQATLTPTPKRLNLRSTETAKKPSRTRLEYEPLTIPKSPGK